jgi:hypothetical protein
VASVPTALSTTVSSLDLPSAGWRYHYRLRNRPHAKARAIKTDLGHDEQQHVLEDVPREELHCLGLHAGSRRAIANDEVVQRAGWFRSSSGDGYAGKLLRLRAHGALVLFGQRAVEQDCRLVSRRRHTPPYVPSRTRRKSVDVRAWSESEPSSSLRPMQDTATSPSLQSACGTHVHDMVIQSSAIVLWKRTSRRWEASSSGVQCCSMAASSGAIWTAMGGSFGRGEGDRCLMGSGRG